MVDRTAREAVIYEALRFANWAAGEGICPVEGQNAAAPEDFLMAYSNATDDEDWETLPDRIAALEAQLAERVKVKPLEWEKGVVDWARPLPGMKYVACSTTLAGSWAFWLDETPDTRAVFASEAEAKAAAQADYERRIISALEATPPAPKVTEKKDVDAIRSRASRVLERMKQTPHGPKRKLLATQHVELTNEALRAEGWNAALTAALSGDAS